MDELANPMMRDDASVFLKGLSFGYRSGVRQIELEEDGVVSVSYGLEQTAVATFQLSSKMLEAPVEFSLRVVLDERGVDGATVRARAEVQRFLASLGAARLDGAS